VYLKEARIVGLSGISARGISTGTARIEAFSDGVIAVIITIMVLELKVPPNARCPRGWETLIAIMPGVLIYALSFVVVAVFWVNHHHLLHAAHHAGTELLWSNIVWIPAVRWMRFGMARYPCGFMQSRGWVPQPWRTGAAVRWH
jgi:hypothetical protein